MKNYIVGLIIVVSMTGCFTDSIKPDVLESYQKKMVVNGVFSSDESLSLELTSSEAAADSFLPNVIKNATVVVTTVDSEVEMTYDVLSERYISNSTFSENTAMSLKISHPSFPNIKSLISLPPSVNGTVTLTEKGGKDTAGLDGDLLQITFDDLAFNLNYYKISIFYFSETISQWIPLNFEKKDPSLAEYNSIVLNDAGVLFSDELFDGKQKTISTVAPAGIVSSNSGDKYRIDLISISPDLYNYYSSLQRAKDAKEVSFNGGFNNAVVIYSNIDNGLGILGAQSKFTGILR